MAKQDKTPQEASNIFHSIMKASVKPKKVLNGDKEESEKATKKPKKQP